MRKYNRLIVNNYKEIIKILLIKGEYEGAGERRYGMGGRGVSDKS